MSLTPEWTMRLVSVNLPGAPATNSSCSWAVLDNETILARTAHT